MNDYVEHGEFERDTDYIPDRITRDGATWPVEPGRYRLVAAKACPWATRAIIVRQLLGLEDVISLGLAAPTHDERSWTLRPRPRRASTRCSASSGSRRRTSPGSPTTTRASPSPRSSTCRPARSSPTTSRGSPTTSSSSGATTTAPDAPDLWPADVRDEMDEVMERVYTEVNNGVYRCGFAGSQERVRAAYDRLWDGAGLARGAARSTGAT